VSHALHPLLEPASALLEDRIRQDLWMRGYCPVCGGEPDMGKLVREPPGARILHCPACGTEWRFTRMACPFCGNKDHEQMTMLTPDKESPLRVDACRKCKRYVKCKDERKLIEGTVIALAAEDLVSLHLDLASEEEGYSN
jgi:FdhE protein